MLFSPGLRKFVLTAHVSVSVGWIGALAGFLALAVAGLIGQMASIAAETALAPSDIRGLRLSILGHAVGGLAVLLWAMALGMYKPKAVTRYGARQR